MPALLEVAVVGVGKLGSIHARVLHELPGARLAGVHDTDPDRAASVAKDHGCPVLADLDQVVAAADAAVIAVPTSDHVFIASELIKAAIPCLVEKPLARTPEEAQTLVDIARDKGVPLMVGHVERFNPAVLALLELELEPGFIEAHRVAPFSFRSADVGVVLDVMIHDIDLILHLVRSRPRSVHAVGVGILGENEDLANARLLFENGAVANVTASRLALKVERKLRLFSPNCYVSLDLVARSGRVVRPGKNLKKRIEDGTLDLGRMSPLEAMLKKIVKSESLKIQKKLEPLMAEDREFLLALREGRDPVVTGEHGVLAMETAEMVVASITENLAGRTT